MTDSHASLPGDCRTDRSRTRRERAKFFNDFDRAPFFATAVASLCSSTNTYAEYVDAIRRLGKQTIESVIKRRTIKVGISIATLARTGALTSAIDVSLSAHAPAASARSVRCQLWLGKRRHILTFFVVSAVSAVSSSLQSLAWAQ
jgi:hypothetical protein